jgi:hypothetical protein
MVSEKRFHVVSLQLNLSIMHFTIVLLLSTQLLFIFSFSSIYDIQVPCMLNLLGILTNGKSHKHTVHGDKGADM